MGKTANCIKMIELLNNGRLYKISELADILETNPRNIIEYKKELEEIGYYITSVPGRYGGYRLDETHILPTLKLTNAEMEAFNNGYLYLLSKQDFLKRAEYDKVVGKIKSTFENEYEEEPFLIVEKNDVIKNDDILNDLYDKLNFAINKMRLITFNYLNNRNKVVTRTCEPYKIYLYNNNWFFIGYCRELDDFRYFKFVRISNLVISDKRFHRDPYYKDSDYFDSTGKKKNNEWYNLKLRVSGYPILKFREEKFGRNQEIEMVDDNEALIDIEMQYKTNIISFILSLGSTCQVIEPQWLKDSIKNEAKKILKFYETNELI